MIKKNNTNADTQKRSAVSIAKPAKKEITTGGAATTREAVKALASKRDVIFAVHEPRAEQVFVCGAFNDWQATPLIRKANRDWKTTVALAPGRYEYKFVIDGKWKIDPRAHQFSPNGFGTLNSVIEVKA
jgi:1,4-alpha-glucan branching enzyme